VSLREFLNEFWAHDTMHLRPGRTRADAGVHSETGPWRSYFADHDVRDVTTGRGAVRHPLLREP
jgi:hypothetical protein